MTKQEMLTQLIETAVGNGWEEHDVENVGISKWFEETLERYIESGMVNQILFSHDFAKAIWGGRDYCTDCHNEKDTYGCRDHGCLEGKLWQYQLQQAVIADNAVEYYWENKP